MGDERGGVGRHEEGNRPGIEGQYCCLTDDGDRSGRCRGGVRRDEEAKERDYLLHNIHWILLLQRMNWNSVRHKRVNSVKTGIQ